MGRRGRSPRPELEVEMETGTGKTFVYTKTVFELNKRYGWSKFIIIVPGVAIREGVKKSIDQKLVKKIEPICIDVTNRAGNTPYVYLSEVRPAKDEPEAIVEIQRQKRTARLTWKRGLSARGTISI